MINRILPQEAGGDFLNARREQEQAYHAEINRVFAHVPRVVVPLLEHDVHGIASLRRVGERLAQRWQPAGKS